MEDSTDNSSNMQQSMFNNFGYTGESILKVRLDTEKLLQSIETFLRGQRAKITVNENGLISEEFVQVSKPLCNEEGIHALISYLQSSINPQTVQGNYEWEHWREEVSWIRESIATDLFVNYDMWDIDPQNLSLICNTIMNTVKPFLTRLVNNEERRSYSNYAQTTTIQNPNAEKSMMSRLFG